MTLIVIKEKVARSSTNFNKFVELAWAPRYFSLLPLPMPVFWVGFPPFG